MRWQLVKMTAFSHRYPSKCRGSKMYDQGTVSYQSISESGLFKSAHLDDFTQQQQELKIIEKKLFHHL